MKYKHAEGLVKEDLGDRVILSLSDTRWVAIEGTAATLWRLLGEAKAVDELVAECVQIYSGSHDQIRQDVANTIQDWTARGIISNVG